MILSSSSSALVAFALVSSATLLALPEISLALVLGLTSSVCASSWAVGVGQGLLLKKHIDP
jgi:hypothetical protein